MEEDSELGAFGSARKYEEEELKEDERNRERDLKSPPKVPLRLMDRIRQLFITGGIKSDGAWIYPEQLSTKESPTANLYPNTNPSNQNVSTRIKYPKSEI